MKLVTDEVAKVLNKYELEELFSAMVHLTEKGIWPQPAPPWIGELKPWIGGGILGGTNASAVQRVVTEYIAEKAFTELMEEREERRQVGMDNNLRD